MALRFMCVDPDTGTNGSPTAWVDQENACIVIQSYLADDAPPAQCAQQTTPGDCARRRHTSFGNGDWAEPPMELRTEPEIVKQCGDAFEAVWDRAVPHEDYGIN